MPFVKSMGTEHVPMAFRCESKQVGRSDVVVGIFADKKRKVIKRSRTIKDKNAAMFFDDREISLNREVGNIFLTGDFYTQSRRIVFPTVIGALDVIAFHTSAR